MVGTARACGPDFPNALLLEGNNAVLGAPVADFRLELERMGLHTPKFPAVHATNGYTAQTADVDIDDLRAALKQAGTPNAELEDIISNHRAERDQLGKFLDAVSAWQESGTGDWIDGQYVRKHDEPRPPFYAFGVKVADGLPDEFADYFRSGIEWHAGHTNEARAGWESLLNRPAAERHYRSTWAAYMLGRAWEDEDAGKAIAYYQQTRAMASAGFADHLGLAEASVGREARLELERAQFERAMELYLEQMAANDDSAVASLRMAAISALCHGGEALPALAGNPRTRRVINACLISGMNHAGELDCAGEGDETNQESQPFSTPVNRWLAAVETANVQDMESAEQLALAAYQGGQWEIAQRWINRAPSTPTAQWLQAKLLLRAGKEEEAAALLAQVVKLFPPEASGPGQQRKPGLQDSLSMNGCTYLTNDVMAPSQVLGELGVLRLSRREYAESLDALLRAGFWMDAAYVAERVLTPDELKNYVDIHWPAMRTTEPTETNAADDTYWQRMDVRREIRHLLGRRLARLERSDEARDYFPADLQTNYDTFVSNLKTGRDGSLPAETRSRALFAAAMMARTNGMELFGTEVAPDWRINDGDFDWGVTAEDRTNSDASNLLAVSADELKRYGENDVEPETRFHYRYQAAALGWEAAGLMPNNSDETARMLCVAGTWLKNINPKEADVFYKSLVRRCRKTAIGGVADRMRWFPVLDHDGSIVPWKPVPPGEMSSPASEANADGSGTPVPGYRYVLNRGDSLQDVADAVRAAHGVDLTVEDILTANSGLRPDELKIGQVVFVPAARPPDQ
jgi:tetratricopeptide (TPR) repeat protein